MKKFLASFFVVGMLAGCSPQSPAAKPKDGMWKGEAEGYNGRIAVEVKVEEGAVKDIVIDEINDTDAIVSRAVPILKERILAEQTPLVDSVSSATYTSFGIKKAVGKALNEAGFNFEEVTLQTVSSQADDSVYEDLNTTLVIAGGGPSGLTAAIEAKENGVEDIIIVEKLDILSGNGKFDEFFFDFPNTKAQKELGIEEDKESFKAELEEMGLIDSPAMLQKRVDEVFTFDAWLRKHGIEANTIDKDRSHMADETTLIGDYAQTILENHVKELGITVKTNTRMTDLLMENNKVTGIQVETNGHLYKISADRVLIATGGFCSNPELVQKYLPEVSHFISSNAIGATGDMVKIAEERGISLKHMDEVQLFNLVIPGTRYQLEAKSHGSIIVNKNGQRFVDENSYYDKEFGDAVLAQEGGVGYMIYPQEKVDEREVGLGTYNKSDTLEELAGKLGINYENLVKSIEEFNEIADGKKEDPFGSDVQQPVIHLDSSAYYGTPIIPSVHMTYGGLEVDEHARVYDTEGNVIENLYAAGEVTATNGIYLESMVFGKAAGSEIAQSLK